MADASQPPSAATVSLDDEEGVRRILTDTVFGLWTLVNNLTRLRPSRRERYRVTIFGSARAQSGTWVYEEVKRLAGELAALGCDIVTGGGPGLMQAANEGAQAKAAADRAQSIGIRVDLPFEQEVNPFAEEAFEHGTFFTRLHHFVLLSDAYVVVPGGIGTVLEATLIWQLLQVRHIRDTPLLFVGEMWSELVSWAGRYMLRPGFELASPEDIDLPRCVSGADEALAVLGAHHRQWEQVRAHPGPASTRE
jgi:uncharacterized protein (TIGR00730 family)